MSWNGSEQLEKAMEELLDDDDGDDEPKVEKSSVEKMEKHSKPETEPQEPKPAGTETCWLFALPLHNQPDSKKWKCFGWHFA